MRLIAALLLVILTPAAVVAQALPPPAQRLLSAAQANDGPRYKQAMALKPEVFPTGDSRTFVLAWRPAGKAPDRWIATLHGHAGYATTDLAIWRPSIEPRGIGIVALQWWFGGGERPSDYYAPPQLHHELGAALARVGAVPGKVMLHGFSRGASNAYAVAAIDGGTKRWFSHVIANAGGFTPDYPPNRKVTDGGYGAAPFSGQAWITVCGGRDPMPNRDGCPAMRLAAGVVTKFGGTIAAAIEETAGDHGAFHRYPENTKRALDLFTGAR